MNWFSTRIKIVCFIGARGAVRYVDSLHLIEAIDFREAFEKALSIGRLQEKQYLNGDNELVRWRLKEIVSLDLLVKGIFDGCEIYSEPNPLVENQSLLETDLCPEKSQPTQTI